MIMTDAMNNQDAGRVLTGRSSIKTVTHKTLEVILRREV
jgi:hypothetical protein